MTRGFRPAGSSRRSDGNKVRRIGRLSLPLLLLIMLILGVPGCWDRVEIDERAFVLGVAIDKVPPTETHIEPIPSQGPLRDNIYEMTVEIPIVSQMMGGRGGEGGGGNGGGGGVPHWVLSSTGADISAISKALTHRSSRILFYGHQKVLILGEELAREGIRPVLDFFERNPEANRRMKLLVSEGEARKVLEVVPKLTQATSLYIYETMEHEYRSSRFIDSNLGRAVGSLREDGNTLLARVRPEKDEVKIAGSALIKDWKLVGWLGEVETRAAMFVIGEVRGGSITIDDPRVEGGELTFEIFSVKRMATPHVQGDDVTIHITVLLEGDIWENTGPKLTISTDTVEIVEKGVEKLVEEDMKTVVAKVQKKFGADIFFFDRLLATRRPRDWERLAPRWDEIFPEVRLEVEARAKVRRFGTVR